MALVHPGTPAYLHGHQLGYSERGWLRCVLTIMEGMAH